MREGTRKALEQRVQVACAARVEEATAVGPGDGGVLQVVGQGRRHRRGRPSPPLGSGLPQSAAACPYGWRGPQAGAEVVSGAEPVSPEQRAPRAAPGRQDRRSPVFSWGARGGGPPLGPAPRPERANRGRSGVSELKNTLRGLDPRTR